MNLQNLNECFDKKLRQESIQAVEEQQKLKCTVRLIVVKNHHV